MGSPWDDTRRAVNESRHIISAVERVATDMAALLVRRLRFVHNPDTLRDLKRELRDFDMVTGRWKR